MYGAAAASGSSGPIAVAVGVSGLITRSTDGINWSSAGITAAPTGTMTDICYSPQLGLFCVVGLSGTCYTSPDGLTWTPRSAGGTTYNGVEWSPELGLFCAVGTGGTIRTSPDGITWTSRTASVFAGVSIASVSWSPNSGLGLFFAYGPGATGATSPDGITWTTVSGTGLNLKEAAWSPSLNMFSCIASVTSGTGIRTWLGPGNPFVSRIAGPAATQTGGGMAWSPSLGMFVAVYDAGGIATSADGTAWATRTSGTTNPLGYGVWSTTLGMFLFAEKGPALPRRSTDGINWSAGTGSSGNYNSVATN